MASEKRPRPTPRRSSRRPYAAALVLMGALVVFAWCGQDRFEPVIAGAPAPEFRAYDLAGQPVQLSDYRGKVLLVNVWATWCVQCLEEMPSMERLYQEVRSRPGGEDFEILAVSVDATLAAPDPLGRGVQSADLLDFASGLGLSYPIVHDPAGSIQRAYQTTGVPESFVVGRDGVIYRKFAGATEWDAPQYLEQIRRLLAG